MPALRPPGDTSTLGRKRAARSIWRSDDAGGSSDTGTPLRGPSTGNVEAKDPYSVIVVDSPILSMPWKWSSLRFVLAGIEDPFPCFQAPAEQMVLC
jgi:hypothetical protein